MKYYIAKAEDRDAVILAFAHNGYTVRQDTEMAPGTKKRVSFVEVVEHGD